MNKWHLFLTVLLMVSVIVSGCGLSAEQAATMTAAVWTATPSPTAIPPPPVQPLGIGSTQVSTKDGMTMVYVLAGDFLMGSPEGEGDDREHPQRTVYLDAYWIDQTEVTNAMFAVFVNNSNYLTDAENAGYSYAYNGSEWLEIQGADWQHPQGPTSSLYSLEDHPVVNVSWNDAQAYCEWAERSLPTEAEWEKAARGTEGQEYPWGDTSPKGNLVNFADINTTYSWSDKILNDGYKDTAPVGSYPDGKSPYGALDMAGNVYEWVIDWDGVYPSGSATNPQGPSTGEYRVLRGGSWDSSAKNIRAANRVAGYPSVANDNSGFRCALSLHSISNLQTPIQALGIGSTQISPKDGMTILYVPEGEFEMGLDEADTAAIFQQCINVSGYAQSDCEGLIGPEKPNHILWLDAFWIDQTEVTNAMFARFVDQTNYETDAEREGFGIVFNESSKEPESTDGADWRHPRGPGSSVDSLQQHPVVQVSWYDASAYCEWAGRRLPTEAEWEKAARGTDGRTYPWGEVKPAGNLLNFADRNFDFVDWADTMTDDGYRYTAPVGSYPDGVSPYEALDMGGNVYEWVADWFSEIYYSNSPTRNPIGPDSGDNRVLHGGSWSHPGWGVRASNRLSFNPLGRLDNIGFRCAISQKKY